MGKHQTKKKTQARRHNPVRVPDNHLGHGALVAGSGGSGPNGIRVGESDVLPIIAKLSAVDPSDRVWACAAISNLITNDSATRRLLQGKNVVGALITRLTDDVEDVIVEACGALRNLCIDGGYDLCAEVYNKGVLSPLITMIPKISSTLENILTRAPVDPKKDHAEVKSRKLVYDLAENVITVLWCLSETSNKALTAVNNLHLAPFLLSFLINRKHFPISLVNAAAQCLYVLTDDNPEVVEEVRAEGGWVNELVTIISGEGDLKNDTLLRVLASGTIQHISPLPPMLPAAAIDIEKTLVLPLILPLLSVNLSAVSEEVEHLVQGLPKPEEVIKTTLPKTDDRTTSQVGLDNIESKLMEVQIALEVLIGICSKIEGASDDDDEEEMVDGDDDEDLNSEELEDMDDLEEMQMDEAMDEMDDDDEPAAPAAIATPITVESTPLPSSLLELLTHLPPLLLSLSTPNKLSFTPSNPPGPSIHPPTTSLLSIIHLRAMESLNNLLGSASSYIPKTDSQGGVNYQSLQSSWDGIFEVAQSVASRDGPGNQVGKELFEVCLGGLMGVAGICKEKLTVTETQITSLITAYQMTPRPQIIRTLSSIAQRSTQEHLVISTFIRDLIASPASVSSKPEKECLLTALDCVFDIYADETSAWDASWKSLGWDKTLKGCTGKVRGVVKSIDKRVEKEFRDWAEVVWENLGGFQKYRKSVA